MWIYEQKNLVKFIMEWSQPRAERPCDMCQRILVRLVRLWITERSCLKWEKDMKTSVIIAVIYTNYAVKLKLEKSLGLNRIRSHDLSEYIIFHIFTLFTWNLHHWYLWVYYELTTWLAPTGRALHRYRGGPVQNWIFFRLKFHNCLSKCVNNCDIHRCLHAECKLETIGCYFFVQDLTIPPSLMSFGKRWNVELDERKKKLTFLVL